MNSHEFTCVCLHLRAFTRIRTRKPVTIDCRSKGRGVDWDDVSRIVLKVQRKPTRPSGLLEWLTWDGGSLDKPCRLGGTFPVTFGAAGGLASDVNSTSAERRRRSRSGRRRRTRRDTSVSPGVRRRIDQGEGRFLWDLRKNVAPEAGT